MSGSFEKSNIHFTKLPQLWGIIVREGSDKHRTKLNNLAVLTKDPQESQKSFLSSYFIRIQTYGANPSETSALDKTETVPACSCLS